MNFSSHVLHHRSIWSLDMLAAPELLALVKIAQRLRQAARAGLFSAPLRDKHLAIVGDGDAAGLLRAAVTELGAKVTSLNTDGVSELHGSSLLLGRLYHAIDCTAPVSAEDIERETGIPVFNGLGGERPSGALAALLTIQDAADQPTSCSTSTPRRAGRSSTAAAAGTTATGTTAALHSRGCSSAT